MFIAVWYGDELLVIRNSYRSGYAIPAGGIKWGETPQQAASRELSEEVAIDVAPEALRFVEEIPTTFEFKHDRCAFFEVLLPDRPAFEVDGREVVWAGFVRSEDATKLRLVQPVRKYLELRRAGVGTVTPL